MSQKWLYTLVLLVAGAIGLNAQEQDTVSARPKPFPVIVAPIHSYPSLPFFRPPAPDTPETKEQKAARINQETFQRVMTSVNHNLSFHRPPVLTDIEKTLLFIGALFLTSPYKFPDGTVPVMNASNPFFYALTPGGEPIVHPYSPEIFPQCIRLEYDFKSGTYNQVMVPWNEFEMNMTRSFGGPYRIEPVPRMQFHSTDHLAP